MKMQTEFSAHCDKIERDGIAFRMAIEPDCFVREPWREEEGHGPVSDWRRPNYAGRYDKRPGELFLCDDGGNVYNGSARFYDFAAACKLALAEGWNAAPYDIPGETPRQQAARAARADYERLRAWANDEWHYCGVIVTASKAGVDLGSASLWGIESDAGEYLVQAANELIEDALEEARATLERLAD